MTDQNANNREIAERWLANAENAELGFMSKMATMIHAVKLCREYPDLEERVEKIEQCITEKQELLMKLLPCKHLDYTDGKYGPDIELRTAAPEYPMVRYWHRGNGWTDNGPGESPNPSNVQFCKLRGRVPGIFQCYILGEMPCYEISENLELIKVRAEK